MLPHIAGLSDVAPVLNQKPLDDFIIGPRRLMMSKCDRAVMFWCPRDHMSAVRKFALFSNCDPILCCSKRRLEEYQRPKVAEQKLTKVSQGITGRQGTD